MNEPALCWNPRRLPEGERGTANFTRPSDAAMPKCIEVLAGFIGPEAAALPSWARRVALDAGTGELLLLLDVPAQWYSPASGEYLVAPEPGPRLDGWMAFQQLAFPVEMAVALLAGSESPELELARRREVVRVRDEIRAAHQVEKDRVAEGERKQREDAEDRKQRFREDHWEKLSKEQRLVLSMSLAVESRDPGLAAELREMAALQGGFLPLPRCEWWLPKDAREA
jgi:hypothetical protein